MGLLMLSTALDYAYGFWVASPNRKKAKFFLWLSILNNLGILAVFKYYNFFALQFQKGFEILGLHTNPIILQVALPIGISFYTFHGMSYVFDIYRGQQKPVRNIVDYAVFVSFFPLLVAGPIERASHLLPQVQKPRFFNYTQAVEGCRLILWGMFKKVVIADSLSIKVDLFYSSPQDFSGITLFLATIAFSFQIYCDFSGYSDIAIGTAKLFGFELLTNFKFPYFSNNIKEFWKRWHISLSSWFRDYIFIPLGGSRKTKVLTIRNILIIFLVSGLWHGASWNFLIWGFLHAILYIIFYFRKRKVESDLKIIKFLRIILTFLSVNFLWVFFRFSSLKGALNLFYFMINDWCKNPLQFFHLPEQGGIIMIYVLPIIIVDYYFRNDERKLRVPDNLFFRYPIYIIISMVIIYFYAYNKGQQFIYFEF
jgi:alginate O-acetyltransferase complex protein AlgI